jgi:hypothetical protein
MTAATNAAIAPLVANCNQGNQRYSRSSRSRFGGILVRFLLDLSCLSDGTVDIRYLLTQVQSSAMLHVSSALKVAIASDALGFAEQCQEQRASLPRWLQSSI